MKIFSRGRTAALIAAALIVLMIVLFFPAIRHFAEEMLRRKRGRATVAERVEQYGDAARARLHPHFERAGILYPPAKIALLGFKAEKVLQVYAASAAAPNDFHFVREYPIVGASGKLGPKLMQGDLQVPEGLYRIESLNPNSLYHLSLRVNYPNAFDREKAAHDGRTSLGGDIMIHGRSASIGCLAMGDPAAEDLFVLAAEIGYHNISVVLSPVDFRRTDVPDGLELPSWAPELYALIRDQLLNFGVPDA